MKLLIFSPYYPPHIGGLETHADEFNKYLSQKGEDITVFTPNLPKNAPENEIKHSNVNVIRFPAFEIISNYPLPKFWNYKFWKLFSKLFGENFDIVISRTRFFSTSLLAFLYAKKNKVRWIHIEHGSDFVKSGGRFSVLVAKFYDYTFGKLVLIYADKVIANSKASAEFCKKLASKINCETIYRGVEIEKIESAVPALEIRNTYQNDIIITFIGRLIDGKGVTDLINSVKDIEKNFRVFIVGSGPQKEDLEKLSKDLKIKDKIIFFGHKSFQETMGILKISDIFVNPSYTEGLPTTVIEAALCKKAIVATNVGGTPEIITNEKSGFLIKPKNVELMKEKIETLIQGKLLREQFGNNAYDEVKEKFNWNKSVEQYLKLFNNPKANEAKR